MAGGQFGDMIDIEFYQKFSDLVESEFRGAKSKDEVFNMLEEIRSREPIIYNIETTNRCNMRCQMCPRTTMMTRGIEDISYTTFKDIVDQIKPHTEDSWNKWKKFCEQKYGIYENGKPSENHFFLYIISKVIQLHGYGDPLLDKNMSSYIELLSERNIQSYFSCNPANIDLDASYRMIDSGLSYLKYSVESIDSSVHSQIRNDKKNIRESIEQIYNIINYRDRKQANTTIVITMLDLNRKNQTEDFQLLREAFEGYDVYIYLKSEDCMWVRGEYHLNKSIHWNEVCKHPWMTMTIKSNGEATMCMEDFNNEIILGNASHEKLIDIWNGEKYMEFRRKHIMGDEHFRCSQRCDMNLLSDYLNSK